MQSGLSLGFEKEAGTTLNQDHCANLHGASTATCTSETAAPFTNKREPSLICAGLPSFQPRSMHKRSHTYYGLGLLLDAALSSGGWLHAADISYSVTVLNHVTATASWRTTITCPDECRSTLTFSKSHKCCCCCSWHPRQNIEIRSLVTSFATIRPDHIQSGNRI